MLKTVQTTKKPVSDYMERRQAEHKPPPTREEIRRHLGWDLVEMAPDERRLHQN